MLPPPAVAPAASELVRQVDCGHDLLDCTEKDTVMQAILAFLDQQHAA